MADPKYRHAHQTARKAWQHRMDAGETVPCWRDGRPVDPRNWQLGHRNGQPSHPEHPYCNMRAGGRIGAMITNATRTRRTTPVQSRRW